MGPLPVDLKPTEGDEGRKTLVPGFMAGIEAMHKRFGRLPFRDLFQPAIYYAENGMRISQVLAAYFNLREKYLSRTVDGRTFMNQAGDGLPKVGDVFAETYVNYAWQARGGGYANTVSEQGWKLYGERVALAASTLTEATYLKEKCPYWFEVMQQVALAQGWDGAKCLGEVALDTA